VTCKAAQQKWRESDASVHSPASHVRLTSGALRAAL
jgi:hypothetical protein